MLAAQPPDKSQLQPLPIQRERSAINLRSATLGLISVIALCAFTPYNDYALNNTFLIGNNLPLGVVMITFLFVLLINGPLNRWRPTWALSAGEMAVVLGMVLVSCSLPSSGLWRYLAPNLVMPFWHARSDIEHLQVLQSLNLPSWLFPTFSGKTVDQWMIDPIVSGFYTRWTGDAPPPYMAWLVPSLTWGFFTFALFGALLCMVAILRRQWVENERLLFPLAQIHLALIEEPDEGRWLNDTLRRWSFWIPFAAVFLVHAWNGAERYYPQYFTRIPLRYDFNDLFSEGPSRWFDSPLKSCTIHFTVIGVTFFLSTPVAFSLWFFYIFSQLIKAWMGEVSGDAEFVGRRDMHFGAVFTFAGMILWVGRHHWMLVIKQAFRGERHNEPRGRYMSYRFAFWGFVLCTVIMITWLCVAGSGIGAAVVSVLVLLTLFLVIARIVAETGLVYAGLSVQLYRPWQYLAMAGSPGAISAQSFHLASMVDTTHYDYREIVPVYASHGMRAMDETVYHGQHMSEDVSRDRSTGRKMMALMMLSLLVGYFVALGSTLWTEYHYAASKDIMQESPINRWGVESNPARITNSTAGYLKGNYPAVHNVAGYITGGVVGTWLLAMLRLRYVWWPLHPVGLLMIGPPAVPRMWIGIFIGWLAKVLIVRFGGSQMYIRSRPFFLGLIVGEAIAAGFWLLMGLLLNALGIPYHSISVMPG